MVALLVSIAVLAGYLAVAGQASGPAALAGLGGMLALAIYAAALWRCAQPLRFRAPRATPRPNGR